MQLIRLEAIRGWTSVGQHRARVPTALSSACPFCGERVIFTLTNAVDDLQRCAVAANGSCPSCGKVVFFWALRTQQVTTTPSENPREVYMYPAAERLYSLPAFLGDLPEPLCRAFLTTVDALNSRNYAATAVCARRTLEGIFKYQLAMDQQNAPLAKLIERTTETVDLAKPLRALSHAIRDGGNLGAHFDIEKEPDEHIALQMVELLDYLISYLYVLPQEIGKLELSLGKSA